MFCINQVEELKEARTTELDISESMTLRSDFKDSRQYRNQLKMVGNH